MSDFLAGCIAGSLGLLIVIVVYRLVSSKRVVLSTSPDSQQESPDHLLDYLLPKGAWETLMGVGNHFGWNRIEVLEKTIRYGLTALLLYKDEEGGIWVRNDDGKTGLVPFPIDDPDFRDNLTIFGDYLNSLDS